MLRTLLSAAVALGALSLSACGQAAEDDPFADSPLAGDYDSNGEASDSKDTKAADVYIAEMTTIADAMDKVEDEESAEAAAHAIAAAVVRINARMQAMEEEPSLSELMAFVGSRREAFFEVSTRVSTRLAELQENHPELTEKIVEELENLDSEF